MSTVSTTAREGLERLRTEQYSNLVTFKRDGTPVATPIWHALVGDTIVMFTEAASFKVKRLRRDPRIEIEPCNWRGVPSGPRWKGRGRVATDDGAIAAAYRELDRKYGWQKWVVDALSRLGGRYDKRAILEIELDG